MLPNRYVLDTNVWVSYFVNGRVDQLYKLVSENEIKLFTSELLIEEIKEVIQRKKIAKYLVGSTKEYIEFHKGICTEIFPEKFYHGLPDPEDNFLIDLALSSQASFIVTGDKKLLVQNAVLGVQFLSLNSFRKLA